VSASGAERRSLLVRSLPWLGLLAAAGAFLSPIRNPDLYWHLSAAEHIIREGRLPRLDWLSHTCAGCPWRDFEWLAQLLYRAVHAAAGCGGLVALRAALMLSVLVVAMRLLRLYGAGPSGRGLAALLLGAALFPFSDLRPDNFSLLFFALLLLALEARRLELLEFCGLAVLAVPAFFALWANLHLGLAFGLALAACYAGGEAADALLPWIYGKGHSGPWTRCVDYLKILALGVLGSLLNPYGWRLYSVAVDHARQMDFLQASICEWMPPDLAKYWTWPYWLILLLSVGLILAHFLKTRRTPYSVMLALGALAVFSSGHQRHLSYFCLVAVPILFWAARELNAAVMYWGAMALAAWLVFFLAAYVWPLAAASAQGACPPAARQMAAFLAAQADGVRGRRLYNSWSDGGYLGLALAPRYRIFCDGRYIFHPLFEETVAAARTAALWREFMDRRGVEVACLKRSLKSSVAEILIARGGLRFAVPRPYHVAYMPRTAWALVYWDAENLVLVRRASADSIWLQRNEYRYLGPDDGLFLAERIRLGQVPLAAARRELERHLGQSKSPDDDLFRALLR